MNELARPMPRPTAQVADYVDVLGADLAVHFLLRFGGAEMYIPADPKGKSALQDLLGYDKLKELAARPRLQRRVPLAKQWLAAMLDWQGHSKAEIARTLRVSDVAVRRWLRPKTATQG